MGKVLDTSLKEKTQNVAKRVKQFNSHQIYIPFAALHLFGQFSNNAVHKIFRTVHINLIVSDS